MDTDAVKVLDDQIKKHLYQDNKTSYAEFLAKIGKNPKAIKNAVSFAKEEGEFVHSYKPYRSRAVKSLEEAQTALYRGEKAAARAATQEKKRASVLPPPASPPTEEKKRSRAEKFGVVETVETNRDKVSLEWSSQSDHRKPVPGGAEADSRPSGSQPPQSQREEESLRARRSAILFNACYAAVSELIPPTKMRDTSSLREHGRLEMR